MTTKHHHITIFLLAFCLGSAAFAEILHWPQFCQGGDLLLKNTTAERQFVWVQKFSDTLADEFDYELPPHQTTAITLDRLPAGEHHTLLHFSPSKSITALYKCGGTTYPVSNIEGGTLTFKKSDLSENKLWLQNLYTANNRVVIELQNRQHQIIHTESLQLSAFEGRLYKLTFSGAAWTHINVTASHRSAVFNLNSGGADLPVRTAPQSSATESTAAYFLVGPRSGDGDTFIARIRNPQMAERARELIKNPQREKILFATIQKDHQGFNRNWSKTEKSFWSWSVTEVTNFDDFGSTACNGSPQEVEDRIDSKVINPGRICFWDYRVKKELTPTEVSSGLSSVP